MEHQKAARGGFALEEPTTLRPAGVEQGAVLVMLDVNKGVTPTALYGALSNVVRKGDNVNILGIVIHIANSLGFMIRVNQSTRNSPNIMELQFEIATKKEAIWRTAHAKEWCQRVGVCWKRYTRRQLNVVAHTLWNALLNESGDDDQKSFMMNGVQLPCL